MVEKDIGAGIAAHILASSPRLQADDLVPLFTYTKTPWLSGREASWRQPSGRRLQPIIEPVRSTGQLGFKVTCFNIGIEATRLQNPHTKQIGLPKKTHFPLFV